MADILKRSFVSMVLSLLFLATAFAQEEQAKADQTAKYWADFMHYSLIANFEEARSYGQQLIDSDPDPILLLDLVESSRYADAYRNLALMQTNTEELKGVATEIVKIVEKGRYLRRQDPKRIDDEIKRLSSTQRGYILAVSRLKDSGEWAVPQMIEALRDPDRNSELEVIKRTLPELGRVAVNPLTVAMLYCESTNIKIIIADVLGEIGYHSALPYLQEIVEDANSTSDLKATAAEAIKKITNINSLPEGVGSAQLYEKLANDYYNKVESLKVPSDQDIANVWFWDNRKGLIKEEVPAEAFDELMTMRYCEHALRRNADLSGAVALWLSGFFRLEADGFDQPQYFGKGHADAGTYALTAGPEYLHRVLLRALENQNRPVALKAITAMRKNAGQSSLLYDLMGRKPLVDALNFPDREVRFSAALAIGQILPVSEFDAAPIVINGLIEAVQQKGQKYAVVIDPDYEARNIIATKLRETYDGSVIGSDSVTDIINKIKEMPSVDLIVISNKTASPDLTASLDLFGNMYQVAFCPTIVLADSENMASTKAAVGNRSFAHIVLRSTDPATLPAIANEILASNNAREFSADLADEYALAAARVLETLCVTRNQVLPLAETQNVLINALKDSRSEIQRSAIIALGSLESTNGQRALAEMSLDTDLDKEIRMMTMDRLAFSARQFGNLLTSEQVNTIYDISGSFTADPTIRSLACQVYGSLNLPSAKVSKLILNQSKNQ